MTAVFIAHQGRSIKILREQKYLFTPAEGMPDASTGKPRSNAQNYETLSSMQPRDLVVVNAGGIVGIATVLNSLAQPMPADFAGADDDVHALIGHMGRRVNVAFEEFANPVRFQDWSDQLLAAQAQGPAIGNLPFAKDGQIARAATFYRMAEPLAGTLLSLLDRAVPVVSNDPGAMSHATAAPYVAKFRQQEERPAQAAFRKLMVKTWGGKCPITGIATEGLLDAAHLVLDDQDQVGHGGYRTGAWRTQNDKNAGLLLCARIHRAVDRGLVRLERSADRTTWRATVLEGGRNEPELMRYDGRTFDNLALGV